MKIYRMIVFAIFTFFVIFGLLIWIYLPALQVNHFDLTKNNTSEAQRANLENQYRVTITQAFVGIAVLYGVYQSWRRITISETALKTSQEGQITERFTRSIDQLGNEKTEIRLGGIYALERISVESNKHYWPIMEILTAYLRENSSFEIPDKKNIIHLAMDIQANESITHKISKAQKLPLDIQAILTVLGRRTHSYKHGEVNRLNLQETNLKGAYLVEANFAGANLEGADLEGANLREAHLERANLRKTSLAGANLEGTNMKGAYLERADLTGANLEKYDFFNNNYLVGVHLMEAKLERANFVGANLERADLSGANLRMADLKGANLRMADLKGADLTGANLEGANLKLAQLRGANLTGANIKSADLLWVRFDEADLSMANLEETHSLSLNRLSKVKTLYQAQLDDKLFKSLKETYPILFEDPFKKE